MARARQLRGRALRPLHRRRVPAPPAGGRFVPLPEAVWRTEAFAGADDAVREGELDLLGKTFPFPPPDWLLPGEPRLRRFHLHYGEDVLAWARRGDGARAREALAAWIHGNPARAGDAWHPYPLSTRVGNWVAALSLEPALATTEVVDSLRRQLAYLERNVEDDVLGNHVIRNARALVLGGSALDLPRLRQCGEKILRRELPEQVLPDGGHYERSPAYHLLVLRDLIEVREAARLDGLDDPLERMGRFAAALSRPDGRPALFNDGAVDLAPALELPPPTDGLATFPESGYAVLRHGTVWLAFDFGLPAPPFLPAHAHADILSFQLWVDGAPVVVDPGTYTYDPGPERQWFRSTAAHSTIELDGRDQFDLWGAFRAGPFPRPVLRSTDPLEAEVAVRGVTHRRRLTFLENELLVEDELEGSGTVAVSSTLPLAAPVSVEPLGELTATGSAGWRSERMLERVPLQLLRAGGRLRLPASLGWRIGLASHG